MVPFPSHFPARFSILNRPGRPALATLAAALTAALALAAACGPRPPDPAGLPDTVDFNLHVNPILSDRCFACHGPDDRARQAGLRFDLHDAALARLDSGRRAIVPGSLRRSALVGRITSDDPDVMMPPPESHLTLSDVEKRTLMRWIQQGAPWKPHWAFIPPEKPATPEVKDAAWARSEIDRFVLAKLEARGLRPSAEATRETLIRRLSFDLTGLPPTNEEIDAFLADDSPDAYEKLVDRLLDSPAYGERLATDWLDVARYADSHGYQDDGMRTMWPWRDWTIEAFNRNLPLDDFITWQLAGDLLPEPTAEQRLATGFNRNHMQSQEGGIVSEEYRVEYVADRVNTFGQAFLGLSLDCARCHDHKYDPVLQKEYYQLFSFFNNVNETGQIPYNGVPSPTLIVKDEKAEKAVADLQEQIRALEAKLEIDDAAFDKGFAAWLQRLPASREIPDPPGLIGNYPLDGIERRKEKTDKGEEREAILFANLADRRRPARLGGDRDRVPETVPGRIGQAQRLAGDSHLDMGKEFAFFERNQPFSLALWFRIDEAGAAGPLVTRSGGIFNGNRGYEIILRGDGTFTAGLHHVFPDNSIEIETLDPVAPGEWRHLTLTYDGSSRAAGLLLFLDGAPARSRTIVDNLRRSIRHGGNGNWGDAPGLRIGRRHDETLQDVSVDDFRVYDRQLSSLEAARVSGAEREGEEALTDALLREHYVLRVDPTYRRLSAELSAVRAKENELLTSLTEVMVMRELPQPRPAFVLTRGAYDARAERVQPGTPEILGAFPDHLPPNRLGLAQWLIDPDHPLTARVFANRYWGLLFGHGLVKTMEDFGNQGRLPTHPELLDWLAIGLVESGWDLKGLLKEIVMSATYRQSSVGDAALMEMDPANELLARGPAYRMSAEQIRDNALAASGLLVRTIGGPSVYPYQPPGLWEELATRNATTYEQGTGDDLYRRSLYTVWKRSTPPPAAMSFDAADRLFCKVRRQRTSTPLQALVLLNDPQYVEAARVLAERMINEGGATPAERIALGFRLLTSRHPSDEERSLLERLLDEERAAFLADRKGAAALLTVGERKRDARLDAAEAAAYTVVASTIMNFDEAVMKR